MALDFILEALGDIPVMTWILSWPEDTRMGWIALACGREHRFQRHQGSKERPKWVVICCFWVLLANLTTG